MCRYTGRCTDGDHSHCALLDRDVCDAEEAVGHGVSTAVRSVLHHRCNGAGRRRTRGTATRRHFSAGLLSQGQFTSHRSRSDQLRLSLCASRCVPRIKMVLDVQFRVGFLALDLLWLRLGVVFGVTLYAES